MVILSRLVIDQNAARRVCLGNDLIAEDGRARSGGPLDHLVDSEAHQMRLQITLRRPQTQRLPERNRLLAPIRRAARISGMIGGQEIAA